MGLTKKKLDFLWMLICKKSIKGQISLEQQKKTKKLFNLINQEILQISDFKI